MNRFTGLTSESKIWVRIKTACLVAGVLSLTACNSVPGPFQTEATMPLRRTVNVTGQGKVSLPTTLTQVSLGVEIQGKNAQEVQQKIAQSSDAVVKLLKSRKVEQLETTSIQFNPVYSTQNNQQRIAGYSGSNIVNFRVETAKIGTLLDDAIQAGATRINGIRFIASDTAVAEARQKAIREATENARQQANAALGALKLTEQEIVNVTINNNGFPPQPDVYNFQGVARMPSPVAATAVVAGDQEVEASVTLQIRY